MRFVFAGLAALTSGQSAWASDAAAAPLIINWLPPADNAGVAVPGLAVFIPPFVDEVGADTFVSRVALPAEAEGVMPSLKAMSARRPAAAEPVLIPVRPALSIGGMMLALLAPVLRHRRLRRMFR